MVLVPAEAREDSEQRGRARSIGRSMKAPVLAVREEDLSSVISLAGPTAEILRPNLESTLDVRFFLAPPAGPPPRPWLIAPEVIGEASLLDVVDVLPRPSDAPRISPRTANALNSTMDELRDLQKIHALLAERPRPDDTPAQWRARRLDSRGSSLTARVYSPVSAEELTDGENVQVRVADRVIWSGHRDDINPGQLVIVEVRDVPPMSLRQRTFGHHSPQVAEALAAVLIDQHRGRLERAAGRAVRAALRHEFEPGTQAAALVLSALSQRVVKRIRPATAEHRIRFALVDVEFAPQALDRPLLRTLDGRGVSLRDLEEFFTRGRGLIYGVRTGVEPDLEGLDRSWILQLNGAEELLLISLVGPSAYVRIDRRDVLARYGRDPFSVPVDESTGAADLAWNRELAMTTHGQDVFCRDLAVGLREYPDLPLLLEGPAIDDGSFFSWPFDRKADCYAQLVGQLARRVRTEVDRSAPDAWDEEEHRRQAWRHLQYFVLRRRDFEETAHIEFFDTFPLFRTSDGRYCDLRAIRNCVERQGAPLRMLDGWSQCAADAPFNGPWENRTTHGKNLVVKELGMHPYLLYLLGESVVGAAESMLSASEVQALHGDEEVFLEEIRFDDDLLEGVIGVPMKPVDTPGVLLFGADRETAQLRRDLGTTFGAIGKVRMKPGAAIDAANRHLSSSCSDLLGHLLARTPRFDRHGTEAELYDRALEVLLYYVGTQLYWRLLPGPEIRMDLRTPLAREILHAPLFGSTRGLPINAARLCHHFARQAAVALTEGNETVDLTVDEYSDIPSPLQQWIDEHLTLEQLGRPSCYRDRPPRPADSRQDPLSATLQYWLHHLRPDSARPAEIGVRADRFFRDSQAGRFCSVSIDDNADRVWLNSGHWLTRWLQHDGESSPRSIAWALLAIYAQINNRSDLVTNADELLFQQRVVTAMERGELRWIDAES